MSNTVLLTAALNLPALEVDALIQGHTIVCFSKIFMTPGRVFALYPSQVTNSEPLDQVYRPAFLSRIEACGSSSRFSPSLVRAWARCEFCQVLDESTPVNTLSRLTVWTTETLRKNIGQQGRIFLVHLRVYKLAQLVDFSTTAKGQFVPLQHKLSSDESIPVLNESIFNKRKKQLIELKPPLYPELEDLQETVSQVIDIYPGARELDDELRMFLGWAGNSLSKQCDEDLDWINSIAETGNSSDGNTFEKLVRKSLIKLGFSNSGNNPKASLDPNSTGGAGGLDVYCDYPYSLVGECKASEHENVPNSVSSQLIHLGNTHLGKTVLDQSIKVLFVAGSLTTAAQQAAVENEMNVMRPETLQKLVKLRATYPGSIDLVKLKSCLNSTPYGEESDTKINQHLEKIGQQLKVYSNLVQTIKQLMDAEPDRTQFGVTEIRAHYNAIFASQDGIRLDELLTHEHLIELCSPLTGYLGRVRVTDLQSDRFYFLRDLIVESEASESSF